MHLPHCWSEDAYHTRNYYRGMGTYSRSLAIPASLAGRRIYLKFDGAAAKSAVYVDGRKAGEHIGAYSPHIVDVTDYVKPGAVHSLTVEVDNSDPAVPPYSADFTFMGGLYRDAWLIDRAAVHSDFSAGPAGGFRLRTEPDGNKGWKLLFSSRLLNHSTKPAVAKLEVVLSDSDGRPVASGRTRVKLGSMTDKDVSLTLRDIRPELWSPEHPVLYGVEMTLSVDGAVLERTTDYTAFRTFAFDDDGRFLLNGKPYKLRGMCRHQDQAPMGYALTDEQHRRDMRLIKDMGANFIRISHYPQDEAVLEMCDRLGLIAWEEVPVIDYVPADSAFADNAEDMLRRMIQRDYNHPSVAMWGYMNEILLRTPAGERRDTWQRTRSLAQRLESVLHDEDPYRLSAMAFHGSDVYHEAGLGDLTDVVGWNLYHGWYGGSLPGFGEYLSRQHREHPGHQLIVSEYGAGSDLRVHSLEPRLFDFSMEYQQEFLEHYLPVIEDSAFVAGASHWNLIDFSSANRAESMPHINNKGLLTNDRRAKDVYHYYRAMWRSDTVAHIAVRDWPRRTELVGPEGYVSRRVKVYTNLPELCLQGERRRVDNCNAVFDVQLRPGINMLQLTDTSGRLLDAAAIELNAIRHEGGRLQLGADELAVNVGSNCYFISDDSGLQWLPDREYTPGSLFGYVGGSPAVTQDEIALTADQPLMQRSRRDIEEYRFDVTPGSYEVELSFADLASPSEQSAYLLGRDAGDGTGTSVSCMDVYINGVAVEQGFAPAELSGVKTMVRRRYHTDATDRVTVSFKACTGAVTSLAAIKIRKI